MENLGKVFVPENDQQKEHLIKNMDLASQIDIDKLNVERSDLYGPD